MNVYTWKLKLKALVDFVQSFLFLEVKLSLVETSQYCEHLIGNCYFPPFALIISHRNLFFSW